VVWGGVIGGEGGGGGGGGGGGVASAVTFLVPLALVWSTLESCAAETVGAFWQRVSGSKEVICVVVWVWGVVGVASR